MTIDFLKNLRPFKKLIVLLSLTPSDSRVAFPSALEIKDSSRYRVRYHFWWSFDSMNLPSQTKVLYREKKQLH